MTNNEMATRLRMAVDYLKRNGWVRNDGEVAERLKVTRSTLSMAMTGQRPATWDLLLALSDLYPISFDWLRNGGKYMIKDEKESALLKRIEELERELAELKR